MVIKNSWTSRFLGQKKLKPVVARDTRCVLCRGSRLLCGKTSCPILVRYYSQMRAKPFIDSLMLEGSSPPSVFIGRIGYPHVFIGPLIPPVHGDTSFLDTPELWKGKSIEEIVDFRSQLVRGKHLVHIKDVNKGKIVELTKELALSKGSPDVEAEFLKKPAGRVVMSDEIQPFGPSAPLKNLRVSSLKTDQKIEKVHSDTNLKAADAVINLYSKEILVTKIQRAFSAGLFGIERNRKFVPTRWSITAVDDIISKNLMEQVRTLPLINEFRVYEHIALDNEWIVLMIPDYWSYEQMEGWYPRTVWNPNGKDVWIISDFEGFDGRTTYAATGGCYYSTRLAVCEHLVEERRQATVITLREIRPGYIMPVGVWHTRESIREALRHEPRKFNSLEEALKYISTRLQTPIGSWAKESDILYNLKYQKKLNDFLK